MDTKYHGVYYHKSFNCGYAARVIYKNRKYWLKTWHTAYDAAQVRDVAAKWIGSPRTKYNNFPVKELPKGVTDVLIARWLMDAGMPMRLMVRRVPPQILAEAGITEYQLLLGGVSADKLLQFKRNPIAP